MTLDVAIADRPANNLTGAGVIVSYPAILLSVYLFRHRESYMKLCTASGVMLHHLAFDLRCLQIKRLHLNT